MQTRVDETAEGAAPGRPELTRSDAGGDLPRYEGPRAEIAHYSGVLLDAQAAGDLEREREAAIRLAHLYTLRGTNLDAAVALARRALVLEEDSALRIELAGWLAGLGDPAGAALELRGAKHAGSDAARARALVQAGVLLARARRADAAALVFDEASELDQDDPIARELSGTLSSWAPEVIPREDGARSYVDAAARRQKLGDEEAALEDLLRAFELCPESGATASAVAEALIARGRALAADEVLRDHAAALETSVASKAAGTALALEVHAARLSAALEDGDVGIALSAAFDIGFTTLVPRPEIEARVDDVLARAGLHDLVAARLERRALERTGAARSVVYDTLARLYASGVSVEDRSAEAWIEAACADPVQSAPFDALRDRAGATGDVEPLVEALVRVVATARPDVTAPRGLLSRLALELASIAEGAGDDPILAVWAYERASAFDPAQADATALARAQTEVAVAEREADIKKAEHAADRESGAGREARLEALRRLARALGKSPITEERAFATLAAVCRADVRDESAARSLMFVFERAPENVTRSELYETVLRARLEASLPKREHVRARLELASLVRHEQSGRRPLDELLPLLERSDLDTFGASHGLLAALAAGSERDEARALVALSIHAERHTAALLAAAASDAFRRAGALSDARKQAERALDLDPACSRGASALARVAASIGGREAAVSIERALSSIVPRAWLCDALARCLEDIGEHELAFAWTHRWLALSPSDRRATSELLRRCQIGTDERRIADALTWVLAQPDPPNERASLVLDGLVLLYSLDRAKGGQIARRVLDVLGPSAAVRERLATIADDHEDAGLSIALLERTVASDAEAPADLYLELAHRRSAVGDFDGAAQELLRATQAEIDPALILDTADDLEQVAQRDEGPNGSRTLPHGLGSDGLVALWEVRARACSALLGLGSSVRPEEDGAEPSEREPRRRTKRAVTRAVTAEAWRVLGALRWDLAYDPRGAELALYSAAEAAGDLAGYRLYASDLCELAGPEKGIAALFERLASLADAPEPGRVALALAAGLHAAEHGFATFALEGALAVLEIDPSNAEAISLAESQAAHVEGGDAAIDRVYRSLAARAMGRFGRRAAHYRAARQLERLGARELALRHALEAFEAVPHEGTTWTLLHRLVDPAEGSEEAVRLFQRVAGEARGEDRIGWIRRAVELSGTSSEGMARRFDVLVSALEDTTDHGLVATLFEVVEKLGAEGLLPPGSCARITKVAGEMLGRLEGPDGARAAAQLARVLAEAATAGDEPSEDAALVLVAFDAIEKAVEIDGELEVYDRIVSAAPKLALFPEHASPFVHRILTRTEDRQALTGPPLLRFASAVADALGDSASSADLLAEAERREAAPLGASEPPLAPTEDPFADPAMFGSLAPAAGAGDRSPDAPSDEEVVPEPLADPSSPSDKPAKPRLELKDSEPPPSSEAADLLSDLQSELLDSTPPPPSAPPSRRGLSGSHPAARPVAELSSIKDGFAALFESVPPPRTDELEEQEEEARRRGDHEAVSTLLEQRIRAASVPDQVRVLKLRRAAVLEQRLARADEAKRELLDVLEQDPDDRSALSFLGDMYEMRDEPASAAPLFERLSGLEDVPPEERRRYAIRAAKAYLDAREPALALRPLDALDRSLVDREVALARVEALRSSGDLFSLVLSIDQVVAEGGSTDEEAAGLLVEAARAASAAGDLQGALIRARRAARLVPTMPAAVLEHICLEYKSRGTGTPREAQAVLDSLQAIAPHLEAEEIELHTFLSAETIDVIHGGGAGLRELSHRHAEVGPLPLIALGMAERLSRSRSFEAAVPLYAQALAGDLRGLRPKTRVALAATDAAIQAGHFAEANAFLEEVAGIPELKGQVERRRREILAFDEDPEVARPILVELLKESTGPLRARLLARLARMTAGADFEHSLELYEQALLLARRDRTTADRIRAEILELLEARGGSSNVETLPAPPSDPEPVSLPEPISEGAEPTSSTSAAEPAEEDASDAPEPEPASDQPASSGRISGDTTQVDPSWMEEVPSSEPEIVATPTEPSALEVGAEEEPAPSDPATRERAPRRAEPLGPAAPQARPLFLNSREEALFQELLEGDLVAGDALVDGYAEMQGARAHDVLVVRRHQAALEPGAIDTLVALRDAAVGDRDDVYARAVEHVLAVAEGLSSVPPPLSAQPREPDLVSALLFRDVASRETEVLAIAWEAGMFRRELASYAVAGNDRVPMTAATVLGESYSEIAACLGSPRPFFHARGDHEPVIEAALLAQPAMIARGSFAKKTPELSYRLAVMHASLATEHVLATYLDDASLSRLFDAMMAAFGPVRPPEDDAPTPSSATRASDVTRLAGELWQRINPRAERRLRELCDFGRLDPAVARRTSRRAARRAGLFVTGDLALARRMLQKEEPELALEGQSLFEASQSSPELADLVRLATRMEYAEARWQLPSPMSMRR